MLIYHEVVKLLVEGGEGDRRVVGAVVRNMVDGEETTIHAAMTINASGAWAGQLAAEAGIEVKVIPGKGTMVAMNHRIVNTVINRCKMPADGDIIVPVHTVAVIGTTDEKVTDPELLRIEPWEVQLMLDEGDKLVPGISKARVLRAWAGVRPLYQEGYSGQSRDATRALTLLDHLKRDGVAGFLTITGGKWTTFRLMAETTMDMACKQLGVERPCKTADTVVPGIEQGHYWLGHRLHEVEEHQLQGAAGLRMRAGHPHACSNRRPSRTRLSPWTTCAGTCAWGWGRARAVSAPTAPPASFTNCSWRAQRPAVQAVQQHRTPRYKPLRR